MIVDRDGGKLLGGSLGWYTRGESREVSTGVCAPAETVRSPATDGATGPPCYFSPAPADESDSDCARTATAPDDSVVDLFCPGRCFARKAVQTGPRAVSWSINPRFLRAPVWACRASTLTPLTSLHSLGGQVER